MNEVAESPIAEYAARALKEHRWAATGVSDYPPRDPLVGQSTFFNRYKTFIKTVDHDEDNFAHVFAVEGEWGKGKSRLGHELVAQINDCSKGWYVRNKQGELESATLFDEDVKRDEYLSLYIRYSQVASEYQNSDNWFGYGLYKALLPLATKEFDHSIQSEIAKQSLRRLEPMGFDNEQLAQALELDKEHSDEDLYYEDTLVTNLVQAAYTYLNQFGIKYVLVVLDELETVAEAATFGLERDEASQLDGQAIRLIGKAIKEEDPRRKLPWLRYVALCSPLLGQQLREIQSTARRFELVELEHNAFADVSDYVAQLKADSKLRFDYPHGLVEAAYAMSGANFGWFNVVMANVDSVLESFAQAGKPIPPVGELFDAVVDASGRVAQHVLDVNAIEGIQTKDNSLRNNARYLLFSQLPVPLAQAGEQASALKLLKNEYDEPVVSLYRLVEWAELDCRQALSAAKFQRDKDEWFYPSVDQGLNLKTLLQNLKTFAVAEQNLTADGLLVPLVRSEFKHLVSLLYNHPAAEFAADALWSRFFGEELQLSEGDATHLGPSVAMMLRLDLRYRSQQHNSMIFRDATFADKHDDAMKKAEAAWGKNPLIRAQTRLIGLYRLLDKQWTYNEAAYPNKQNLAIQVPVRAMGKAGGLQFCEGLKLHPKGQAWFAWVNNYDELKRLNELVASMAATEGRVPVMAFTGSVAVTDQYSTLVDKDNEALKDNILLYHLNTSEIDVIERIGLQRAYCGGFNLKEEAFTTKFKTRLNSIRDFAYQRIHQWRHRLSERGLIAWPIRPSGKINQDDRQLLFKAWQLLAIKEPKLGGLHGITPAHGLDAADVAALFGRLSVSNKVLAQGYGVNEHSALFIDIEQPSNAEAQITNFLAKIANINKPESDSWWSIEKARQHWYWGYLWAGASNGLNDRNIFDDWMWWLQQLQLFKVEDPTQSKVRWVTKSRAEFGNAVTEAEMWLTGDDEDSYKAVVGQLSSVYGEKRIGTFFAVGGEKGTETTKATDALKRARDTFAKLEVKETQLQDSLAEVVENLPDILRMRNVILSEVDSVKPHDGREIKLDSTRSIVLNDESVSLYERIERARLFADKMQSWAGEIRKRVDNLLLDIEANPKANAPFPRRLFTLSLQTIANILKGALEGGTATQTQKKEASADSDTLLFYLRDLQLEKARERMERLAVEVGYDLHSGTEKGVEDINGFIIRTYRQFLSQYNAVVENSNDLELRIKSALVQLGEDCPADYPNKSQSTEILALQNQLSFVADSFEELDEKVDELRNQFIQHTHKGQFSAIQDIPERLLKPIKAQLNTIGGKLLQQENVIARYRKEKLEDFNAELRPFLNPLLKAKGELIIEPLSISEFDSLSLHDYVVELDIRNMTWQKRVEELLGDTGINVERWKEIASTLLAKRQPVISAQEQQALVEKGILKVQIAFGGEL